MPASCDAFQAAWVSTVINLDWPSKASLKVSDDKARAKMQKDELIKLLDRAKELGINAIIFQVSPTADAFFVSSYLPWSPYLTGTLGKDPGYDPLDFTIREAHKRRIQVHAWLNPYRVSMDTKPDTIRMLKNTPDGSPPSVYKKHPSWIAVASDRFVLDPGIPAVRKRVADITGELVKNYKVDGIQFDDYFYYETPTSRLDDSKSFARYGTKFTSKADWRRYNTYMLVKEVGERIKATRPNVRFGISPGGVWRNKKDDPLGSDTQAGSTNYDNDFADTRKWVKDGLIDYIAPQVYWSVNREDVSYRKIVNWWSDTVHGTGTDLYIGMALYKAGEVLSREPAWAEADGLAEIRRQIAINEKLPEVKGSILFRFNFLELPQLKRIADFFENHWVKKNNAKK